MCMLETSLLGWLPNVDLCRRSGVSGIHSIRPTKNVKHCSSLLKEIKSKLGAECLPHLVGNLVMICSDLVGQRIPT